MNKTNDEQVQLPSAPMSDSARVNDSNSSQQMHIHGTDERRHPLAECINADEAGTNSPSESLAEEATQQNSMTDEENWELLSLLVPD